MAERWYIYGWHTAGATVAAISGVTAVSADTDDDAETSTVLTEIVPGDKDIDSDHVAPSEG
jgi:hypothetical protein